MVEDEDNTEQNYEILIPYLEMTGKSGLTFEIKKAKKLEMFFDSTIIMEAESLLDFD